MPHLARLVRAVPLAAALGAALAAPAGAAPAPGTAAPAFTAPLARGGAIASRSLRGEPVYLNFFASWCGPCNDEAPGLPALERKYARRGLRVIGVDEQEDRSKALGFASKYGWRFPIALDAGDVAKAYGVFGLPVHVFIDRRGAVSLVRFGEMSAGEIDAALARIAA